MCSTALRYSSVGVDGRFIEMCRRARRSGRYELAAPQRGRRAAARSAATCERRVRPEQPFDVGVAYAQHARARGPRTERHGSTAANEQLAWFRSSVTSAADAAVASRQRRRSSTRGRCAGPRPCPPSRRAQVRPPRRVSARRLQTGSAAGSTSPPVEARAHRQRMRDQRPCCADCECADQPRPTRGRACRCTRRAAGALASPAAAGSPRRRGIAHRVRELCSVRGRRWPEARSRRDHTHTHCTHTHTHAPERRHRRRGEFSAALSRCVSRSSAAEAPRSRRRARSAASAAPDAATARLKSSPCAPTTPRSRASSTA